MFRLNVDNFAIIDSSVSEEWVEVGTATAPYTLEGLERLTYYEVQVQAVYGDDESQWAPVRSSAPVHRHPFVGICNADAAGKRICNARPIPVTARLRTFQMRQNAVSVGKTGRNPVPNGEFMPGKQGVSAGEARTERPLRI
jgi:hypothetical protein